MKRKFWILSFIGGLAVSVNFASLGAVQAQAVVAPVSLGSNPVSKVSSTPKESPAFQAFIASMSSWLAASGSLKSAAQPPQAQVRKLESEVDAHVKHVPSSNKQKAEARSVRLRVAGLTSASTSPLYYRGHYSPSVTTRPMTMPEKVLRLESTMKTQEISDYSLFDSSQPRRNYYNRSFAAQ